MNVSIDVTTRRWGVCLLACVSGGLVLAGCDDDDDLLVPDPDPDVYTWETQLAGSEGWEQLGGGAEVRWEDGSMTFTADASLTGDEEDAVRPWHVHFDTCDSGGGIVGQDGEYPRLEVDEDGSAQASVTVPLPLEPGEDYHVNVHLSDEELETIIACGDLDLLGTGTESRTDEEDDDDGNY